MIMIIRSLLYYYLLLLLLLFPKDKGKTENTNQNRFYSLNLSSPTLINW